MITTRYIDVAFCGARSAMARALYQYDYGQILRITDLTLPFAYEVHFADTKTGNSVTMIGNADGVEIPDACLLTSGNVYCWFYLHDTESDGETRYEVLIPILSRAKPTNAAPTPVQQDVIDQAIAALDAAVQQTGEDVIAAGASASAAAGSASDAEAWAVGERDGEPVESTDPTYHNNSKYYAGEAASAAQTASQDAQTASDAAIAAGNAKTAAETAQGKAETAQEKAEAAQTAAEDAADQTALDVIAAADSADEASGYANTASGYASTASGYATAARGHAQDASGYASSASGYATNAYNSATAAAGSAGEASGYATSASGYASAANDAKLAAQGAQTAAETAQGLAEAAQTGAEAAQTAAETARDAAIAATEDKAPVILDSASGAIVSIVDGAQGMNARSFVASMEPIQDLHGQARPYPAGGGRNLLPFGDVEGLKAVNTAGTWSGNQYSRNGIIFTVLTDSGGNVLGLKVDGTSTAGTSMQVKGVSQFTIPAGTYTFTGVDESSGGYDLNIRKQGETTDTVQRGSPVTLTYSEDTVISSAYLWVNNNKTLSNVYVYPMICDSSDPNRTVFSPYSNICPISGRTELNVYHSGEDTSNPTIYPISWQTEAGTVYGGTVDVVSGVLTVTHGFVTYSGKSGEWAKESTYNYFYTNQLVSGAVDENTKRANQISNIYPFGNIANSNTDTGLCLIWKRIRVRLADMSISIDDWNSMLSATPLQVCYKLATPTTYQLTPTQVQMLLGANNVWATGDSVSLTYPCDTKLYIERLTEPTEDDMVANANIPIHKFFMIGNSLYYSTAAIASGESIVVGTNCSLVSFADALNQINA